MSFDRLAPHYDWMERVLAGDRLQRARTVWLEQLADCRRILSVGEGHGRFAAVCAARFPEAELTVLDSSTGMLTRARRRLPPSASVRWIHADILHWSDSRRYDAIVTHFFLDCFPPEQLAAVVARLGAVATDRAIWLVSDFALPPDGPARWRARAVHALMYAFFRRATRLPARRLTPPDTFLTRAGFALQSRHRTEWDLVHADCWRRNCD